MRSHSRQATEAPDAALSSGSLEALKWIALLAMLGDHVNSALFARQLPVLGELGRIAFPLFACVFGCNLARPDPEWRRTYRRVLKRLLLFGLLSLPFSVLAFARYDLLPLNILFTFAIGLGLVWCVRRGDSIGAMLGSVLFLGGGLLVEFSWPGLVLVVAAWTCFAYPGVASHAFVLACVCALWFVNGNFYALLAYPVIAGIALLPVGLPRNRWLFYVFYPAHLAMLAALRHLLP